MRVLLVNTSEHAGGAAIAARRIMNALTKNGVEATMLVRDAAGGDERVTPLPRSPLLRWNFLAERLQIAASNGFSRRRLFEIDTATHGTDITRLDCFRRADIVHLHWVNQGFLSLRGLRKIAASGKPVVWTLHDMWPFTGICHTALDCRRWTEGCGACPVLNRPAEADLSRRTYLRKARLYASGTFHFVACSRWLASLAQAAPLLRGQPVTSIPNPIDTGFFSPADQGAARRSLGLPENRTLLLFAAYKATDKKKGTDYLREALTEVARRRPRLVPRLGLIVAGREAEQLAGAMPVEVFPQGYVGDEAGMRRLYRSADLLLMPTLADNLPNTIVEAMACGVPCVGFDVGGLPQMIDTGKNGYLARYRDARDFAEGILRTLSCEQPAALREGARQKALLSYSEAAVASCYKSLYESII